MVVVSLNIVTQCALRIHVKSVDTHTNVWQLRRLFIFAWYIFYLPCCHVMLCKSLSLCLYDTDSNHPPPTPHN